MNLLAVILLRVLIGIGVVAAAPMAGISTIPTLVIGTDRRRSPALAIQADAASTITVSSAGEYYSDEQSKPWVNKRTAKQRNKAWAKKRRR